MKRIHLTGVVFFSSKLATRCFFYQISTTDTYPLPSQKKARRKKMQRLFTELTDMMLSGLFIEQTTDSIVYVTLEKVDWINAEQKKRIYDKMSRHPDHVFCKQGYEQMKLPRIPYSMLVHAWMCLINSEEVYVCDKEGNPSWLREPLVDLPHVNFYLKTAGKLYLEGDFLYFDDEGGSSLLDNEDLRARVHLKMRTNNLELKTGYFVYGYDWETTAIEEGGEMKARVTFRAFKTV